jgi:hypothetical protein
VKVVGGSWIYNFPIHHILHFYSTFWRKRSQRRVDRLKTSASALQSAAGEVCAARRAPAVAPASACMRIVPHRLEVRAAVPFAPAVLGTRAVFTASYRAVLPGGPSSASLLGAAA